MDGRRLAPPTASLLNGPPAKPAPVVEGLKPFARSWQTTPATAVSGKDISTPPRAACWQSCVRRGHRVMKVASPVDEGEQPGLKNVSFRHEKSLLRRGAATANCARCTEWMATSTALQYVDGPQTRPGAGRSCQGLGAWGPELIEPFLAQDAAVLARGPKPQKGFSTTEYRRACIVNFKLDLLLASWSNHEHRVRAVRLPEFCPGTR